MSICALRSRAYRAVIFFTMLMLGVYPTSAYANDSITIRKSNITALELIQILDDQTPFTFSYSQEQLSAIQVDKVEIVNKTLQQTLDQLTVNYNLSFATRDKNISVKVNPKRASQKAVRVGSIRGKIFDAENNEALIGSTVLIAGTQNGVTADTQGNFVFRNIQPGTYALIVSFVGYQTQRLENITVTDGNETVINIPLSPSAEKLSEVLITESVDVRYTPIVNSTEESLISEIRSASNIVTGISNMQIARSLDRDAADVMRRVPGVTMLNNFVLVRGMDPRYNITYLNNMMVPSTESDSRAFGFNLIPSGLIDDIKIYKAPAPELPGGFGGGVIRVNTKKSQTTRHIQVDLSTQYRTGSSFSDYHSGTSGSNRDWIGGGIKDRELPGEFRDKNFQLPNSNFYMPERVAFIRSLPPVNQLQRKRGNLDKRFSINYYDSYLFGKVRVSNLTAFGYTNQRTNEFRTRSDRGIQQWVRDADGKPLYFRPENQLQDSIYIENVRLSLLENLSVRINEKNTISFNLFANRNAEDNTAVSSEWNDAGNPATYPIKNGDPFQFRRVGYEYRVRDLVSGQLHGEHVLNEKQKLSWSLGRSQQTDYIPDWQSFLFQRAATDNRYNWAISTQNQDANSRQSYRTHETVDIGTLDYSATVLPFLTVNAGMFVQMAQRSFTNFNYHVVQPTNSTIDNVFTNLYQPWFKTAEMYADENFKEDGTGLDLRFSFAASAGSYSFTHNITAGYIATRFTLLQNKLELYGGLRYENEYAELYDASGKPARDIVVPPNKPLPGPVFEYYLPSVNLTWNVSEKHKLRTSFGKTIDRPAYRERSIGQYYSIRDNVNYFGNTYLENARLDNYDLRWEWYPTAGEFIAVGGYYKSIQKPIEMQEYGASGTAKMYRGWVNKGSAELYGVEVEVHKNLGFIPGRFMKQFNLILNGSYMYTVVNEIITIGTTQLDARPTRPLAGSSPLAVNGNLYYEHPKLKTQFTVSYNYIGERIIATSPSFIGNLHEQEQHLFDLTLIQPIGKHLKMKAGVQNLLNRDMVRWRDGNYDGKYNPGLLRPADQLLDPSFANQADHEAERWNPGAYYSLGITATF